VLVPFAGGPQAEGWLHRRDPRVKLVAVVATTVALLLADRLGTMVLTIAAIHAVLASSGIRPRRLLAVWRSLAPVLVLVVALWPVFDRAGAPVLVALGWFRITADALARGLAAAGRLAAISLVVFAWTTSTGPRALIRGFVRLGLPERWGIALAIGLRAIPTVHETYRAVADAQAARGLQLNGPLQRRVRNIPPVLVATLVTTLRGADQLARALEARGLGGPARATTRRDLTMDRLDRVVLGLAVVASVVLLLARLGVGVD
jgi:energy-coupling factor transporter transmembrane protein EcfT